MKRRTRKRTPARRGLQHVGEVLATLVAEFESDEVAESNSTQKTDAACPGLGIGSPSVDIQDTFSFYQPLEV